MYPLTIRDYEAEDAPHMARLYYASARTLGLWRYSPEQVAAWAPAPADPALVHARARDGRTTLVAVTPDAELLGYGDLEPSGHIDHLYCRPDAAGRGVAPALLQALLARAESAGLPRVFVEASELARGLFERHGFRLVARRDFEVRSVAIHNYAMERRLG